MLMLRQVCELQCTDCTVFEWLLGTVWEEYICLEIVCVSIVTQLFSKSYPRFPFKHFFFYFLFSFIISKQSCFLTFVCVARCLLGCEICVGVDPISLSFILTIFSSTFFFASFLPSKFINNLFSARHYETHHVPRGTWVCERCILFSYKAHYLIEIAGKPRLSHSIWHREDTQ